MVEGYNHPYRGPRFSKLRNRASYACRCLPYYFTKEEYILASDKKNTPLDVGIDFIDEYAFNGVLKDEIGFQFWFSVNI